MKIECDKCSAKYSIADEKVRGKTFKIRCKKCSNVIIVRDKVAADAAGEGDDGSGAYDEPAQQAQPGWHLAINGETVGPMPEQEVRERYEAREIDKDTAVWQEGFEDWIPLGDVDVFADLPDYDDAGGDDPFASANQDEYAPPAGGGLGAASAGFGAAAGGLAAAAAQPEPQSPRVSQLTGQRNENSVLFSLDSLQAIATGGGAAAAAAPAKSAGATKRGLATAAPSSEGSGLIDIRALGAMVGNQDQPSGIADTSMPRAAAEDAALPSFGGAGLGGLAATPLVPQTTPVEHAAVAAQPPPRSNAPLYLMMGVMILMVAGMGLYVFVLKEDPPPPETVVVEKHILPDVKSAAKDDDEKEEKKDDDDGEDEESEGEQEDDGDAGSGTARKPAAKRPASKPGSTKSSPSSSPTPTSTSSSSSQPAKKEDSGSLDVDCILNPDLAKCKKGGGSKPSASKPAAGASDPSLPEKLSQSDIKSGVDKVLSQARSCGSKHGAKPGEVVRVRISISGATGTVSSAAAQDPHQGTPLGNCVAAALKSATFSKFRSSSMGAVYPVRM
jgi:predicted Zn finger-like uncharacterized protein